MHIPDGFLDTRTVVATSVISAAAVGAALRHTRRTLPPKSVPLMGLMAAVVFAGQMLNFPVAAGTSGHLMGGVLVAVIVGPAPAILVMTAVLATQAFLFADGGVLALGANVLNIGVLSPLVGYGVYRLIRRFASGERGRIVSLSVAAWCSTLVAAVVCSGELAWSGIAPWGTVVTAMTNVHLLIGVFEGVISALVVAGIARVRPELLDSSGNGSRSGEYAVAGVLVALALALFVAPFASAWPDGLERVAATLGFDHRAIEGSGAMAGYAFPGVDAPVAATMIAGAIGVVAVFGLSILLARLLVPHSRQ